MEVEEHQQVPLIFSLSNGKTIQVSRDLLPSFPTLENMIVDLPSEMSQLIIPLPEFITKPFVQWAIDAAIIYRIKGQTIQSFDDLYKDIAFYNAVSHLRSNESPLFSLFGNSRLPDKEDLSILFKLIDVLNWLGMQNLVVLAIDKVYQILNKLYTTEIESLLTHKKRKRTEQAALIITLPLTIHYHREQIIRDFLLESLPHELVRAKILTRKYINPIAKGWRHVLFLKPDGLYGYGENAAGQLGITESRLEEITKLLLPSRVTPLIIAAADRHSLCWTTGGLYGCGTAKLGQLGLAEKWKTFKVWTSIAIEGEVLQIAASTSFTIISTTTGLYASGANSYGQLGLGDERDRALFTKVKVTDQVLNIAVGTTFTLVLTTTGLYGCGKNNDRANHILSPLNGNIVPRLSRLDIDTFGTIWDIGAGYLHSMILTDGGLITAGDNSLGQRGLGAQLVDKPIIVIIPEETIKNVYCGTFATFALTMKGNLYVTGENQEGTLGIGSEKIINTFTLCVGLEGEILSITNSKDYTFVLTTTGLYFAGDIDYLFQHNYVASATNPFAFTKTSINMGYVLESLVLEEPRKRRHLQCWQCSGKAKFMSQKDDLLPFCSKYCLYKSSLRCK